MATELKVIMFTDQIDSTRHMAEGRAAEMKRDAGQFAVPMVRRWVTRKLA